VNCFFYYISCFIDSQDGSSLRFCGAGKRTGAKSQEGEVTLKAHPMLEECFPQWVSITVDRYCVGE
jgi:hypothetical protein